MPSLRPALLGLISAAVIALPCLAQIAAPSGTTPVHHDKVLKTVALIIGEPNYSVDGAYQELEEGFYTQPELLPGNIVFAPLNEIILNLGGSARLDVARQSATFALAGHTMKLTAGRQDVILDGRTIKTDVMPEWRNDNLWTSAYWVFDQFGAFTKWDKPRQRFTASLILPLRKETAGQATGGNYTVKSLLKQPATFWATPDGSKVAHVILGYQNTDGGWPKLETNIDLTVPVNRDALEGFKAKSTIDNDSTYIQIVSLARAYQASHAIPFRAGAEKGIAYLLAAQLPNGGWQQFWPNPMGYKARITFNDNAITNTMSILKEVADRKGDFSFIDEALAARARVAYDKGLTLILKTQSRVDGKLAGWAAQYDENTLAPAPGRAFELASISGGESVDVVRFLMSIEPPSPEVVTAIQGAVAWFDATRITGVKRERREDRTLEFGFDFVMVPDAAAPPLWPRFYDLQTGRPLFSARDGKPRTSLDKVSYERRVRYNWYTTAATDLLTQDYPAWIKAHGLESAIHSR